jgi:hypothetical protein
MRTAEGIRTLREWLIELRVPALVQQADERPAAIPPKAALPTVGRDVPVATAPATE